MLRQRKETNRTSSEHLSALKINVSCIGLTEIYQVALPYSLFAYLCYLPFEWGVGGEGSGFPAIPHVLNETHV